MNLDALDDGRALMAAKRQPGDVDSELAHAIRDFCGGCDKVPEFLAAAVGEVQAELKRRVRREWHESQMTAGHEERLALENSLTGHAARNRELCAELKSTRETLDSVAYDIGELPARFVAGDVPAAASLIRALPDVREAIRRADSVLDDNG